MMVSFPYFMDVNLRQAKSTDLGIQLGKIAVSPKNLDTCTQVSGVGCQ